MYERDELRQGIGSFAGIGLLALLTRFSGLCFASGVMPGVGDAGGAGGGGEDAGESGGDTGDGGVGDQGGDGDGEPGVEEGDQGEETGEEEGEEELGDEGEEGGEGGEEEEGAGKAAKPNIEKSLNKLKKLDPAGAKQLRREHFQNEQYRGAFESPQQAQEAADLLSLVGGEEGIGELQTKADDFANELTMVAEGNPAILDDIIRDTPDGFKKLMGSGMEKLRLLDAAAHDRILARPMIAALREKNVLGTLASIKTMCEAGKGQEAWNLAESLLQWAARAEEYANRQSAAEGPSERDRAADAKIAKAEKIARQSYQREVGTETNKVTNAQIKRHLDPLIRDARKRGVKLSNDQLADVASGIYTEIANSLKINSGYQRQMNAYYAKEAAAEDIARYVDGKVASLAERAAKKVWARKGWASARGRVNGSGAQKERGAAGSNGAPASKGVLRLSKPPEPDQVNWSKDVSRARWMGDGKFGEATLKSGRVVRFPW